MDKKRIIRTGISASIGTIALAVIAGILAITLIVVGIFGGKLFGNNKNVTVYVEDCQALVGDTLKIPVQIDKNDGLWMGLVEVNYNPDVLDFISCTNGDVFDGCEVNDTGNCIVFILSQNDLKNTKANGIVATLNFEIKETATKGEYLIDIDGINSEFCTVEKPEELIKPKIKDGKLTVK